MHSKDLHFPRRFDTIIQNFSLIWYASLNNKTFQLFDSSIILVFWRTRFNLSSCSFSNIERFTTRPWKLVNNIWFTKLVQLIFHIGEKRHFCDRIMANEINFLISGASQFLKTFFSINAHLFSRVIKRTCNSCRLSD